MLTKFQLATSNRAWLLTVLIVSLNGSINCDDEVVEIETKIGKLKCNKVTFDEKPVVRCEGVPYAKPPIEDLRFKLPEAITEPSAEPIEALAAKPFCMQTGSDMAMPQQVKDMVDQIKEKDPCGGALQIGLEMAAQTNFSEDCLYLNIFAPGDIDPESKLPVILFLHPGLFNMGGIGISQLDGTALAVKGQVIVVTVQYRLGTFGFLYSGTEEIPGNMGLWDQRQAMIWLKENAPSFGGDPENVVLMGDDAGAWSAGVHYLSPESKDLFSKAIMISGSALNPMLLLGQTSCIKRFEKFAAAAKCPLGEKAEGSEYLTLTPETFDCIRKLEPSALLAAVEETMASKKDVGFCPCEGDKLIPVNPWDAVKEGEIIGFEKPLLLGTMGMEGGLIVAAALNDIYPLLEGEPKALTLNDLIEKIKAQGGNSGQIQMMLPMFFRGVDKNNPQAVRERLVGLVSDGLYTCTDALFINALTKAGGKVFQFILEYRASCSIYANWISQGTHLDDVQFVFGRPFLHPEKYNDNDRSISALVMELFSNFARTGDPSLPDKPWKPLDGKVREHVMITAKGFELKKGLPKNLCKDLSRYYSMGRSFLKAYKPS